MRRFLLGAGLFLVTGVATAAVLPSPIDFGSGGTTGGQNAFTLQSALGASPRVVTAAAGALYVAPLTGATVTFPAIVSGTSTVSEIWIDPAGTIAALTIALPPCAAANDGDERVWSTSRVITSLTVTPVSGTLSNGAATAGAVGVGHGYHCVGASTLWFQMY